MKTRVGSALGLLLLVTSCHEEKRPDAYGNVEAIEVVVGAESAGRIEELRVQEGDTLAAGAIVGTIETTSLGLERHLLEAQRDASAARLGEIAQRIDALEVQRHVASRAYGRTKRLAERHAATAQQLDADEREYRVLGERIEGERAQAETVRRDVAAADARVAVVSERVAKGEIRNPISGTVLATYARAGEVTQAGQPLYRIADLQNLEVRAYVVETQLAAVRLGQTVDVSVDVGAGQREVLAGTVTWVSAEAEFTPTPIQTREERADLVYAIKIRVPNPKGLLKIGMPADVGIQAQTASR